MGGKSAIALGLVAGVAAGAILVGGLLVLTPGPVVAPTPSPPPATSPPAASPSASPSAAPSASPGDSPSLTPAAPLPSGPGPVTNSPAPSASTAAKVFGIGRPPPLVL
jgi:hypothetical protein